MINIYWEKKKNENVKLPMISSLPGSQVREQFDEQSTGNLQLLSSHGQADFEKKEMLIKNCIAITPRINK
jgi:hypothetical protein